MNGGTWGRAYSNGDMLEWDYVFDQKEFDLLLIKGKVVIVWGANNYIVPPSRCWLIWEKPQIRHYQMLKWHGQISMLRRK